MIIGPLYIRFNVAVGLLLILLQLHGVALTSPTVKPSQKPTNEPTLKPTSPSSAPSDFPSALPSSFPTSYPSFSPSADPSAYPTTLPTPITYDVYWLQQDLYFPNPCIGSQIEHQSSVFTDTVLSFLRPNITVTFQNVSVNNNSPARSRRLLSPVVSPSAAPSSSSSIPPSVSPSAPSSIPTLRPSPSLTSAPSFSQSMKPSYELANHFLITYTIKIAENPHMYAFSRVENQLQLQVALATIVASTSTQLSANSPFTFELQQSAIKYQLSNPSELNVYLLAQGNSKPIQIYPLYQPTTFSPSANPTTGPTHSPTVKKNLQLSSQGTTVVIIVVVLFVVVILIVSILCVRFHKDSQYNIAAIEIKQKYSSKHANNMTMGDIYADKSLATTFSPTKTHKSIL